MSVVVGLVQVTRWKPSLRISPMTGQILGALLGSSALPSEIIDRIPEAGEIRKTSAAFAHYVISVRSS